MIRGLYDLLDGFALVRRSDAHHGENLGLDRQRLGQFTTCPAGPRSLPGARDCPDARPRGLAAVTGIPGGRLTTTAFAPTAFRALAVHLTRDAWWCPDMETPLMARCFDTV
jgi:hypothetical protein